jgi:hypothetical protein
LCIADIQGKGLAGEHPRKVLHMTNADLPVRSGFGSTNSRYCASELPDPAIRMQAGAGPDPIERLVSSLVRAMAGAPVENRLPIFAMICRVGREYADANRQQVIDELWSGAQESGLIELVGLTHAQIALAVSEPAAAGKIAVGEYDGLSGTFAEACREADQRVRIKKNPRDKRSGRSRLSKPTLDAVDFLLKQNDEARLRKFLEGRSEEELHRIEKYILLKTSI